MTVNTFTVFERVRQIVCDQLGVSFELATLDADLTKDLNADSLDLVELAMSLEEEFSSEGKLLEISDEEAEKINCIGAALEFLKGKGITD